MRDLEKILEEDFMEFKSFHIDFLSLNSAQVKTLNENEPRLIVSKRFRNYAALEFSNKAGYTGKFRPEAVHNPLARAEEYGHYIDLVSNPGHRTDVLQAKKGSEQYLKLEYRAEYIARLMALVYLEHKGIKDYNQVWSSIRKNKIILATEPLSTKAHYLGYTKAEEDFATLKPQQLKEKLKRILFSNDLSEFNDTYRQMPKIVEVPEAYLPAA